MSERGDAVRPDASTLSTGELITRLSEQVSTLVRDELALARAELVEKGKRAGIGAGLFGGGGVLVFYGTGALIATAVLALALVWPAWLAALVVAAGLFAVAAVLALLGRGQFKRAVPPVPAEAAGSVAADVGTVKAAIAEARRP